ncbi:MAG: hypothetical protein HOO93_07780 [Methyloglobulus sp.]|nr:hypothetical protein [Methyloglobulus sp.]
MKKNNLNKAILGLLGVATLSAVSLQAQAFTATDLGTFTGTTITQNDVTPFKSWSDYGTNVNYGWVHTADWFKLQVGSAADITAGNTLNVEFKLAGSGAKPLNTGGFTLWTSGTAATVAGGGFHEYNQVRGPNDGGITTNNNIGNVVSGHNGWVGYAQNGLSFTNGDGDAVANGGAWNTSSPYLTGGAASSVGGATLDLYGLKAGYYLIGLGGVCPDLNAGCMLTDPTLFARNYTFTVATAAPVPLPAAVWLMMGGLMGLLGLQKRKVVA